VPVFAVVGEIVLGFAPVAASGAPLTSLWPGSRCRSRRTEIERNDGCHQRADKRQHLLKYRKPKAAENTQKAIAFAQRRDAAEAAITVVRESVSTRPAPNRDGRLSRSVTRPQP
jgi:hypothetical protein